jgi:hypothetical protein
MIETAAGPVTDRPVRPRTARLSSPQAPSGVEIGCARARRSRTSRSGPSGLITHCTSKSNGSPAEAFRNSRGGGRVRPRHLGQFRLSFSAEPRWTPRSSGEVRFEPCHTLVLINSGAAGLQVGATRCSWEIEYGILE